MDVRDDRKDLLSLAREWVSWTASVWSFTNFTTVVRGLIFSVYTVLQLAYALSLAATLAHDVGRFIIVEKSGQNLEDEGICRAGG
jgi:hypothetical protein